MGWFSLNALDAPRRQHVRVATQQVHCVRRQIGALQLAPALWTAEHSGAYEVLVLRDHIHQRRPPELGSHRRNPERWASSKRRKRGEECAAVHEHTSVTPKRLSVCIARTRGQMRDQFLNVRFVQNTPHPYQHLGSCSSRGRKKYDGTSLHARIGGTGVSPGGRDATRRTV